MRQAVLSNWRTLATRPRLWAGAGALALIVGVCGADAQSGGATPWATPDQPTSGSTPPMLSAQSQASTLKAAVDAAQRGDVTGARAMQASLSDPVARKLVLWAMVDSAGSSVDFFTLDQAQRDLAGWPRSQRRQAAAEKAMETASISPTAVIAWFATRAPTTPEGAMALASAYQQSGRAVDAAPLIKNWWRNKPFGPETQATMLARFGIHLTAEDHAARLSMLLYLPNTAGSANALLAFVTPDQQALARARLALRSERSDGMAMASAVPANLQSDPGLAFDRARYLRKHNLDTIAVGYLKGVSAPALSPDVAGAVWAERRSLMMSALRSGNAQGAYAAAASSGLTQGTDYTEAEFFAGWVALTRLKDPALADQHFARVETAGATPITLSRAAYWRGRAAAARGDAAAAQAYWLQGSKYLTAFYGQLSAEKAGITRISLGRDPQPAAADRARYEAREVVRAARMLGDAGERDAFKAFAAAAVDQLASPEELVLLVDMVRLYGDQDLSMRIVRSGAMKGYILPERGYPLRTAPQGYGLPEPAFTLAITRQESGFDPVVRSPVGARGMMQLMPGTASNVARRIGVGYSPGQLDNPDYNMRLGAAYLGQITDQLGGSYPMAAAGYNAGPGRAQQWASDCGDPRQSTTDPADYIECIPFSETRNYVMRVMENMQVYHARLAGGSAPLTLTADLHRGGWTAPSGQQQAAALPGAPIPYGDVQTR